MPVRWDRLRGEVVPVQRPVLSKYGMTVVWAGIQCPTVGTETGVEYPVSRANGRVRVRRIGFRTALLGDVVSIRGRESLPSGSGVPAVAPSIILSQIGEVRPAAGVIRSQPVLSLSSSGFQSALRDLAPRCEIP